MFTLNNNKIIVGTAQFGLNYGINNFSGKISEEQAFEILNYSYSSGIKYIDSAEAYGDAHKVVGNYHAKFQNSIFKVITKIPDNINDSIEKKAFDYLNDLKVDKIDILMYHSFQTFYKDLKLGEKEMMGLKTKGIIDKTGVSIYTNEEFEKAIETNWIDVIQFPFNMLDNFSKRGELLLKAKQKGKILHARSAFLQGIFFVDRDREIKIVQKLKPYLNKIDGISQKYNIPINLLALGYCINQHLIDNILIGVNSLSQLISNIDAVNIDIPEDVMLELDAIEVPNVNLLNPSLWSM